MDSNLQLQIRNQYDLIHNWHIQFNASLPDSEFKAQSQRPSARAYFDLVKKLPSSDLATLECMGFIFMQVRRGLLEWACGKKVENNLALIEVAKKGGELLKKLDGKYSDNFDWESRCNLGKQFGNDWIKYYPDDRTFDCIECGVNQLVGNISVDGIIYKKRICFDCRDRHYSDYSWEMTYE